MTVEPIKDIEKLQILLKGIKSTRNRLMLAIAYFACLRISDVLKVRVADLKREVLEVKEQKTKKIKQVEISMNFRKTLDELLPKWIKEVNERWNIKLNDEDYVFISQRSKKYHLTRVQAYRIIKKEAKVAGIYGHIGTHTMRKSAAWQAYIKDGIAGAQRICNHSSPTETIRYLGVTKEFEQKVYSSLDKALGIID